MQIIRPSADLRSKYNEMSKLCKDTQEPICITVNGRGDTVLISLSRYNSMLQELNLLQDLAEAENDIRNNRVAPVAEMFVEVRNTLKTLKNNG